MSSIAHIYTYTKENSSFLAIGIHLDKDLIVDLIIFKSTRMNLKQLSIISFPHITKILFFKREWNLYPRKSLPSLLDIRCFLWEYECNIVASSFFLKFLRWFESKSS